MLLVLIFFVAFFLRFYLLGHIPFGFYQDESAIGFNAYSIMETGKDEYGNSFPLYFKSFGDYKLPIYIYTATFPIKVFGLNEFAVRFPSAFFGFLTVVVFYFFVKSFTNNQRLSIMATLLLALNPWHLHYSRATFEVSISLFLFVLGGLLLYKALTNGTRGFFLLGIICFILDIYSYNLTRLLSPLLLLLILFIYRQKVKSVSKNEFIATGLFSIALLIPFFVTLFGNGGVSSAGGTLIFSSATIKAAILELRSYFIVLPALLTKFLFNNPILMIWQYIEHIMSYFSVQFFFISGSEHGNHGIGNVGQFYMFEFILIIVGILKSLKERGKWAMFMVFWAVIVIAVASLTREAPHATRSFFLLVPLEIFSAYGALAIWSWVKENGLGKHSKITTLGVFVSILFISYNLIYYFSSYYFRFPTAYAKAWRSEDKSISLFLKENQGKYNKIVFDKDAGFVYTSLLFYTAYPPSVFQKTVTREPDNSEGFSNVASFGKYEFKDIDWVKDGDLVNTLFITSEKKRPKDMPILKTFTYPKRPVVIPVGQKIIQYPVEEVAYVVVESQKK